ncbi:MAG: hypothetical protein Kow0059_16440 [Candidatus Sumerlaeia bacterium]
MAWLEGLARQVTAAGGAQVVHILPDVAPRLRPAPGSDLRVLEDAPRIGVEQLDALADALIGDRGRAALERSGEVEFPLESWRAATGQLWMCRVSLFNRGHRCLTLRRIDDVEQWLKEEWNE